MYGYIIILQTYSDSRQRLPTSKRKAYSREVLEGYTRCCTLLAVFAQFESLILKLGKANFNEHVKNETVHHS